MENMKFCSLTHCIATDSKLRLIFYLGTFGPGGAGMIDREIKPVLFSCCGNENRDGDAEDNVDKNYFIIYLRIQRCL